MSIYSYNAELKEHTEIPASRKEKIEYLLFAIPFLFTAIVWMPPLLLYQYLREKHWIN